MLMTMSSCNLMPRSVVLQVLTCSKMMVLMSIAENGYATFLKKGTDGSHINKKPGILFYYLDYVV